METERKEERRGRAGVVVVADCDRMMVRGIAEQ